QHSWILSFDKAQQEIEDFWEWCAMDDQLQRLVLCLEQLGVFVSELFCLLALCDLVKKDRNSIRGRINAVLKPAVPWLIIVLHLNENLFVHGLLVGQMKGLPDTFWKFSPDMLSNEVLGQPSEQAGGLPVYVGVAPCFV